MLFRAWFERNEITHQSRLSCTLDTVQSEKEWRGICAFFLVIVTMCLDLIEDERYTVLGLVVYYLVGHFSVSLPVPVRMYVVVVKEEDSMPTADKHTTGLLMSWQWRSESGVISWILTSLHRLGEIPGILEYDGSIAYGCEVFMCKSSHMIVRVRMSSTVLSPDHFIIPRTFFGSWHVKGERNKANGHESNFSEVTVDGQALDERGYSKR
jgi:hypothetical protein